MTRAVNFAITYLKTSFINIRNGYGIFSERSGKNHKCLKPLHQIKIRIEFASIPAGYLKQTYIATGIQIQHIGN